MLSLSEYLSSDPFSVEGIRPAILSLCYAACMLYHHLSVACSSARGTPSDNWLSV